MYLTSSANNPAPQLIASRLHTCEPHMFANNDGFFLETVASPLDKPPLKQTDETISAGTVAHALLYLIHTPRSLVITLSYYVNTPAVTHIIMFCSSDMHLFHLFFLRNRRHAYSLLFMEKMPGTRSSTRPHQRTTYQTCSTTNFASCCRWTWR